MVKKGLLERDGKEEERRERELSFQLCVLSSKQLLTRVVACVVPSVTTQWPLRVAGGSVWKLLKLDHQCYEQSSEVCML
jgi:hypothetical protein